MEQILSLSERRVSIERIDTTTRIVLIEFDVQTGRILIVSTKNRIDQLRLFIYLFFFSSSCYFEVGIYKPLSFDLDLFFRRSGQFLDTCSAVQRWITGSSFLWESRELGFKSQRASYFHPVRVEKQPGPEFFWELTGAKVSIRLEITTCGE